MAVPVIVQMKTKYSCARFHPSIVYISRVVIQANTVLVHAVCKDHYAAISWVNCLAVVVYIVVENFIWCSVIKASIIIIETVCTGFRRTLKMYNVKPNWFNLL